MKSIKFRDDVDEIIEMINSRFNSPTIERGSIETQWNRGNGTVIRTDADNMATLSINLHEGFYGVGCDGDKVGINDYLARNFCLHRENSQNIRYRCPSDRLWTVIVYFASIKASPDVCHCNK